MSTALPATPFHLANAIAGYQMLERIGAGGCGEVWRAQAPGGITKAIKIVFGYHDDERAARELASLNRIKEVRHPFLLSLERIELVDGHLFIVTELATSSLKQLCDQYRQSGQPGIPRRELLTHLRDAADALDYICVEHSLQHLDVKPENLLLVGGRVKVADFGLVKDLADVSSSSMGGLTPLYAAPELFEGRPNNRTDQYSLAILYQELLTGTLPYEGRTTAQLASQHLHSRPRVDSLPVGDQQIVARALSKDPARRFASCREMVDHLLDEGKQPATPRVAIGPVPISPSMDGPSKTEMLDWQQLSGTPTGALLQALRDAGTAVAPRELGPIDLGSSEPRYRPTVFVGIGGLAATTLQALRRRFNDRFGDIRRAPAVQMLLFDTDAESLSRATEGGGDSTLADHAVVLLPLRQAADYRREGGAHQSWLSRRWLFNIPRSLQTMGFRPLGRLALVDHIERARERLAFAIGQATTAENISSSATALHLSIAQLPPRVVIVASMSGGTGSGVALDVGYLVRHILQESELAGAELCGVFAHCAGRGTESRDLAVANTHAFLTEVRHFSDPTNAYPGDASGGIPAFGAEVSPFDCTYVVNLGEDLDAQEFSAGSELLADYLFAGAFTPAASFFDHCRGTDHLPGTHPSPNPVARTFGLARLGFAGEDVPTTTVDELCHALVKRWRGVETTKGEERSASLADTTALMTKQMAAGNQELALRSAVTHKAAETGVHVPHCIEVLSTAAIEALGAEPKPYLNTVLTDLVNNFRAARGDAKALPPIDLALDSLDALLRSAGPHEAQRACLSNVVEKRVHELADEQGAAFREWLLGKVVSPGERVEGAQRAIDCLSEHLRGLIRQAGDLLQAARFDRLGLRDTLRAEHAAGKPWIRRRGGLFGKRSIAATDNLARYFLLGIDELLLWGATQLTGALLAQLSALDDRLRNLAADLNQVSQEFQSRQTSSVSPTSAAATLPPTDAALDALIAARKTDLLIELEQLAEHELRHISLADKYNVRFELPPALRRMARTVILRALKRMSVQRLAGGGKCSDNDTRFSLKAGLRAAAPRLDQCGGARRVLLVAPEKISNMKLAEILGEEMAALPTLVVDAEDDALICVECEQLPLRRIAAAILGDRFQFVEVAERLLTRVDVRWTSL